jgi:hypothetical protein
MNERMDILMYFECLFVLLSISLCFSVYLHIRLNRHRCKPRHRKHNIAVTVILGKNMDAIVVWIDGCMHAWVVGGWMY